MLSNLLRPPEPTPSLLVLKSPPLAATFKIGGEYDDKYILSENVDKFV